MYKLALFMSYWHQKWGNYGLILKELHSLEVKNCPLRALAQCGWNGAINRV